MAKSNDTLNIAKIVVIIVPLLYCTRIILFIPEGEK